MMIKVITQTNKEKIAFWVLASLAVLLVGFYLYCINTITRNVVSRENLENEATKIALEISNKEFQYISLRNSVTVDLAYTMGFKEPSEKAFINKDSGGLVSYAPNRP